MTKKRDLPSMPDVLPPEGADRALWDLACDMVTERILLPEQQEPLEGTDARRRCLALLGPEELQRLVDSPREAARYFYII